MADFFGKYRGTIVNAVDPEDRGRIEVVVQDGPSTDSVWAMPCFPSGMFMIPDEYSAVWVEFERGDPSFPVWSGCFYPLGDPLPAAADAAANPGVPVIAMHTPRGHSITISDATGSDGGITIKSANGTQVVVNDSGIQIKNELGAKIELNGPIVSINNDALKVV